MRLVIAILLPLLFAACIGGAYDSPAPGGKEWHVSVAGDDANDGAKARPLRTISAAAKLAQPGDVVTVHAGVYRERVSPPRGGVVYQAARGEKVVIKGSEVVKGWTHVGKDAWMVALPNSFFGGYNPFADLIHGDWFNRKNRDHHTGAVYLNGHWLTEAATQEEVIAYAIQIPRWFAKVDDKNTTVWAQFWGVDPNREEVEVNVRRAVFYPDKPGVNDITVRGFIMRHAATQWAPPTAEQIGLVGTHWSRGWLIENNVISHSVCTGIALGKHGDEFDNTSQDTAVGYVKTIERAHARGWTRDNIGHHVVRNNHISHCEQAGIVGSLGAAFSTVTGNRIHDIHVRRLFGGAEMAGIKFHAAIDTLIADNYIYRTTRGIWLDWMTQGTRVTRNVVYQSGDHDLFVEVNHGPFLVDNNLFLSPGSVRDWSQGGAYVHNLMAGQLIQRPVLNRETPYHKAHSTEVAGIVKIEGGDSRFINNIFAGGTGLLPYDKAVFPMRLEGNVFLAGAEPSKHDRNATTLPDYDPAIKIDEREDGLYLHVTLDRSWAEKGREVVTTELLGKAKIPDLPFVHPDDSPIRIDTDYFRSKRDPQNPFPGPFTAARCGKQVLKVWPR